MTNKQADKPPRENEHLTRTFLDATSDMVFLKDESFRYLNVNAALCKFYGKAESEIIGKTDFDLMPEKAAAACRKTDEQTLLANDLHISEEVVEDRCYETRKFPVELAEGKKGIGAYIRDITERKKAKEELIRAVQEWQITFVAANDLIWLLDAEQRVVRSNKISERFFKRSCDELVGLHCWEIVHGTTEPIPECPIMRAKKSLRRETVELQIGDSWFNVTVDPVLDATGQYGGAVHIVRDITDRKQTEIALRESEALFHALANSGQALIWTAGIDKKCNYLNQSWLKFTGRTIEEEAGDGWIQDVYPDDLRRCTKIYAGAFDRREKFSMNYRLRRHDGEYRWIQNDGAPRFNSAGEFIGYIGHCLDITERKLIEEALREKEAQYRNMADAGLALIWTAGTDKLCNYFNQPWLKFTGRTLEQEMGNGWTQGVHPDDLDRCVSIYVTAFDKREAFDMEYRLRHVSGEHKWIRDLGTPNYDIKGNFIGYIGHCFDITAHREAEEKIRNLNELLEMKIEERTSELRRTIALLEETNRVFVGRELKMAELKERIAELEKK